MGHLKQPRLTFQQGGAEVGALEAQGGLPTGPLRDLLAPCWSLLLQQPGLEFVDRSETDDSPNFHQDDRTNSEV